LTYLRDCGSCTLNDVGGTPEDGLVSSEYRQILIAKLDEVFEVGDTGSCLLETGTDCRHGSYGGMVERDVEEESFV
ncbi:hypothetical protein B0T20DRAFT_355726, partial [Sordaria brevicollis]